VGEKTALIFGSVPCQDWHFLRHYPVLDTCRVICADGGIHNALAAGITPDVLIGDWDSGGAPAPGITCVTLPAEKDMTDLQAAADLALSQGCRCLYLCGCTGGPRLDHAAANLFLLEWIAARGGRAVLLDPGNEIRLLDAGEYDLPNAPPFRYFSLLPLDREISDLSLSGVKYPLDHARLTRGDTLSVSNEPSGSKIHLSFAAGRLLLIRSEPVN